MHSLRYALKTFSTYHRGYASEGFESHALIVHESHRLRTDFRIEIQVMVL